jgi:drug/metabolite transporter (DMT)-like permease
MKRERLLAFAAFVTVCIVWGTTYLGIAVAIETLPTFLFPGLRFSIAGAVLLAICLFRGYRLPTARADWLNIFLIGVLMVGVANLAVVWAEHHVSSGFAALLVATAPFWMALLELMRRHGERLTRRKVVGMAVGFAGVAVLVAPELRFEGTGGMFLLGVLALQVGSIAWNLGSIRSKYHMSASLPPLLSAALQMLAGGIVVAVIGLARGEAAQFVFSTRSLIAFLYLVIFGSIVAYGAYVYALSKLPTSTISLYAYVNPLVAVYLGWLILDERIGWNALLAMVVIFAGMALVQTAKPAAAKTIKFPKLGEPERANGTTGP